MEFALKRPDAVLIAGPTASGKSAVGLLLAERLGGAMLLKAAPALDRFLIAPE